MGEFSHDLKLALRGVLRRPAQSLAVIVILAVGIGATTAIFSVFNWILFRPLPGVRAPGELVAIRFQRANSSARFFVSYRDYADLREGMPAVSGLAASAPMALNVGAAAGDPERIDGELVTTNYFEVLGVTPAPGRDFVPAEERSAALPAAIISRTFWNRRFNGDPSALGQTLTLNGHSFTIVGIAPANFHGRSATTSTDIWVPIGAHNEIVPGSGEDLLTSRARTLYMDAIGRLRPGATMDQARQQAVAAASAPDFAGRPGASVRGRVYPTLYAGLGQDTFAKDRLTTIFTILMGAVSLVLLLACANAANILLARGVARRREIAVYQAIGASRMRIVRQQLADGLVLAAMAGVAGLLVAAWFTSLFDGMRILTFMPAVTGVSIDWRVCAFTLLASFLTGLLFSLAPAIATMRIDLQMSLRDGLTSTRRKGRLLRSGLVVLQVAACVTLLVGAGLFIRTLDNIRLLDLGLDLKGVVSFSVDPSKQGYGAERAQQYFSDLLARLRSSSGIESAAFSWTTPYGGARSEMAFMLHGGPDKTLDAASNQISPGFFETLRIPIIAGRDFTDAEYLRAATTTGVTIVSERFVREFYPAGGALGSHLMIDYPHPMELEIVGIVGDVRGSPLTNEPEPYTYEPAGQRWPNTWGTVEVRSALPPDRAAAIIRDAVRATDPNLPAYDIEPFGAAIDRSLSEQRLFARLAGIFAAIAALIAATGIYAMLAGIAAERRREFGIRLALGATAQTVLALVLRTALTVSLAGITVGLAVTAVLSRVIETRLYGVSRLDPFTLIVACGGLTVVALGASVLPALRAARTDPLTSLRVDG
jgi:putative ABC transport system permease protein